jgi:hypothetical protein
VTPPAPLTTTQPPLSIPRASSSACAAMSAGMGNAPPASHDASGGRAATVAAGARSDRACPETAAQAPICLTPRVNRLVERN